MKYRFFVILYVLLCRGGVYSAGAAFGKTSLVKELNENGVTFEILSQKDI